MSTITANETRGLASSRDGTAISYETMGSGEGVLVLGGAWSAGRDYRRLGEALAHTFTVHLIDRRGRGGSGPQGAHYSIDREVEDLLAVQAATGARIVFGHSYGGLVALEAARRTTVLSDVVVYEPGVSVAGSIPTGWVDGYRRRLAAGDRRGAFATMVRGAGAAPSAIERMPFWCTRLVLRLAIRERQWQRIDPMLETGAAEHEQVAALDDGTVERYRTITARVLLLGGGRGPAYSGSALFEPLSAAIGNCTSELIDGLDHVAPSEKAPEQVAERIRLHLRG